MRAIRIATVGLGVTLGCIVAGAVAGMLCLGAIDLTLHGWIEAMRELDLSYAFAALVGGICGLLVGPLAAFGFLRRVPLGRLFAETTLAATLGGVLGVVLRLSIPGLLKCSVAGFALAVAHLAWRYRAPREPAHQTLAD